jgi:hypothetical protein
MRARLSTWAERHAVDFLILAAFCAGYLFGLLAPEPAVKLLALAGYVYVIARHLERVLPWAP